MDSYSSLNLRLTLLCRLYVSYRLSGQLIVFFKACPFVERHYSVAGICLIRAFDAELVPASFVLQAFR